MSVTPTMPVSTPDSRVWVILVIILIVYVPAAQLPGMLADLITLSTALAYGSAAGLSTSKQPQTVL